mmetsp:Transcript_14057/g.21900  ORF Transcript_14057/g.21900 Transcript_14057/m.21900 type:complete len:202 (-) Transcript_14057:299-904(-)
MVVNVEFRRVVLLPSKDVTVDRIVIDAVSTPVLGFDHPHYLQVTSSVLHLTKHFLLVGLQATMSSFEPIVLISIIIFVLCKTIIESAELVGDRLLRLFLVELQRQRNVGVAGVVEVVGDGQVIKLGDDGLLDELPLFSHHHVLELEHKVAENSEQKEDGEAPTWACLESVVALVVQLHRLPVDVLAPDIVRKAAVEVRPEA